MDFGSKTLMGNSLELCMFGQCFSGKEPRIIIFDLDFSSINYDLQDLDIAVSGRSMSLERFTHVSKVRCYLRAKFQYLDHRKYDYEKNLSF